MDTGPRETNTTALVTGGTSGIGRETVRCLAETGATVLVHGRNLERGEAVCEDVTHSTPGQARFYRADFADLEAVRALADRIQDDVSAGRFDDAGLDVLVNNAGTWQEQRRLVAATGERTDGTRAAVEYTVAVNHCAHVLLTAELWPLLRAAAEGSAADGESGGARVVTVSSAIHRRADFDLDALTGATGPTGQAAYAHSKLANALFSAELARRAEGTGVTANSCHPGVAPSTALARDSSGLSRTIWKSFGAVGRVLPFGPIDTEAEAASTQCYLATSPAVAGVTGEHFADRQRKAPSAAAQSEANARELWNWTADVVDVSPTFPTD